MGAKMKCKNCDKDISDFYTYCPHCGQKSNISRLNFRQLINDIWVAFSNTDKGVLLLIRELVYKPGQVSREYIYGRRKIYFNPFSYLAIMVAVALYFILRFENVGLDYSHLETNDVELLQFAFKYFNVFILLMCPIYALFIWLFFLGQKFNYVENLVLSAYLSGQTMLYYIAALIIFVIFPSAVNVLGMIIGFMISIWYIVAILQFYQTRSFWSILKAILVIIISQIVSQGLIIYTFSFYKELIG